MNNALGFVKQYRLIIGIAAVLILIVAAGWAADWWQTKQNLVKSGLASPAFPFKEYTLEELDKLYPEYPQANIPDRQTPEQTHAIFIQALKDGDIEKALDQMTENGKKNWGDTLYEIKKNGFLDEAIKNWSIITSKSKGDIIASYHYSYRDSEGHIMDGIIEFFKYPNGDWKIESL